MELMAALLLGGELLAERCRTDDLMAADDAKHWFQATDDLLTGIRSKDFLCIC